ncbi:MAG: PQQ-binding-like beta-propeller repeat protein [Thermoleophilia bacterium]|nr:PQQ-binding-like beta-propeller repeat protein [Gaiellaceae bacterium]MDW8338179.1 PQQ-binding-like beta-propeller repeat protein [Thermoleophilia bacterium]
MPKPFAWILAAATGLVIALAGAAVAVWILRPDPTVGALDTELEGVTVSEETAPSPPPRPPEPEERVDRRCWREFGGSPLRSLARPGAPLGLPRRRPLWTRVLDGYIEFAPVTCDGMLYVNSVRGTTYALDALTGTIEWTARVGGTTPSSPAIAGPRLLVSSQAGTVTALDRRSGRRLWQVRTSGKVESSPVVVDGLAYFGSHDGRLFAVSARTGAIRWAYQTRGRINASPTVVGHLVCVTNYAGAFVCLDRRTGAERWTTYVERDPLRYESFYASASSDGVRLYSVARSGKVVAVDLSSGDIAWTARVGGLGYTTPAIARDRIFAGGFDGRLRAFRRATGAELWSTDVGGRIFGAPIVVGDTVFVSVHEGKTYGLRISDGEVVWRLPMGRYTPGIATERTYYFSLNARLLAYRGRNAPAR